MTNITFLLKIFFAVFPDFIKENNALTASLTSLFLADIT